MVAELAPIADVLDQASGVTHHGEALAWARGSLRAPDALPSARVLQVMTRDYGGSHTDFALAKSIQTRRTLMQLPFSDDDRARFAQVARSSLEEQRRLEENETVPFEDFRLSYLASKRLRL